MVVVFISGSMFGGKSRNLMDCIEETQIDENASSLVFKPTKDTRDGCFIKSRDKDEVIKAEPWDEDAEDVYVNFYALAGKLNNENVLSKNIFFDESHFLSLRGVEFIINTCKRFDINIYFSGLETDFKLNYFPVGKWLKENCDSYIFLNGRCEKCGKANAIYNVLHDEKGKIVKEGDSIQVGDSEYSVMCEECRKKVS